MAPKAPFKKYRITVETLDALFRRKEKDGAQGSHTAYLESVLKKHASGECQDVANLRAQVELELRREMQSELLSALKPQEKPIQAAGAERVKKHGQRKAS